MNINYQCGTIVTTPLSYRDTISRLSTSFRGPLNFRFFGPRLSCAGGRKGRWLALYNIVTQVHYKVTYMDMESSNWLCDDLVVHDNDTLTRMNLAIDEISSQTIYLSRASGAGSKQLPVQRWAKARQRGE